MEIFVCCELSESQVASMQEIATDDAIYFHAECETDAPPDQYFRTCEIVFGNVPPGWLTQTTTLRWIQLESVGFGEYANLNWRELNKHISLTNLSGFFAEPVAESALAGILSIYRGIERLVRLQLDRNWQGAALRKNFRTLAGANVILFGYGSINRRFAELLAPFNCKVTHFGSGWAAQDLDTALRDADVVVCVAPETKATTHVFDSARLGLLKDTALFVNFGRGSVVVEDALVRALRSGHLGGAVIDVTLCEPLPREHELWTCPNTIITQHSGGGTQDEMDRKIDVFADNLTRYRKGRPLAGVVDFERGY